ncbi:conserved hypothetical protein [Coccidioides posadasii str. Silveira]|uniref:Uncharacterized protein n=1 Tax=Coccidioides posadasii (strain RMSCC 757 / Silveira) TaxID=443226 RepID=E9DIV4_COCPS|nr:conserved hypothetical protein [Coccidioides posadasii str. Silveira]
MGSYPGRRGCVCVRACYSWENRGMSVTIPLSSEPNRELGCALATATSAAKGSNTKYGRERDRGKAALDYLSAIAVIYLGTLLPFRASYFCIFWSTIDAVGLWAAYGNPRMSYSSAHTEYDSEGV